MYAQIAEILVLLSQIYDFLSRMSLCTFPCVDFNLAQSYNDSTWQSAAVVAKAPTGVLSAPTIQPIRKVQTYTAVKLSEPAPGVYVFDFGQNMVSQFPFQETICVQREIVITHTSKKYR